jgi:hypothetical protein
MLRKTISEIGRGFVTKSDYDYERNLNKALSNTKSFGLSIENFEIDLRVNVDIDSLLNVANETIYFRYPRELIAGRCHQMSMELSKAIKTKFNINSVVTSGYLICNKGGDISKVFYEPLYFLRNRIGRKTNREFPIHCWVTLPNMVIVDVTVLSTLQTIGSSSHQTLDYRQSYFISGKIQSSKSEFCYQPIMVGNEFIESLNLPITGYIITN